MLLASDRIHARWPLSDVFRTVATYLSQHTTEEAAEAAFLQDIQRRVRAHA